MRSIEHYDPVLTYAQVLDALPIVAFVARADGSIVYVSRGWTEFTGVAGADVVGEGYRAVIHPDHRQRVLAVWQAARAAATTYVDEFLFRFGDGSYRWVLSSANPMRDPADGDVIGWFGTVADIDGRKRNEEALRVQAEFNERLIGSTDDCIKILDLDGHLLSMSPNGQKVLGIADIGAVIGMSWLDFWDGDDRAAAQFAVRAAVAGETGRFTGYYPIAAAPHWFDVVVTAICDASGRPEKLLAVSRDITEQRVTTEALKESEQRHRAFSEALPGMTWSASPHGTLDYISKRWIEMGRAPEEALGDAWLDALHPEDRANTLASWHAALATGEPYETQYRFAVADGSYRWHLVRGLPLRDDTGAIRRWVGVSIDIDQQRRAANEREFLSEASRIFAGSLDLQMTLQTIAALTIPAFADWCRIDLRMPKGRIATAAIAHRDEDKHKLAQRFVGLVYSDPDSRRGNAYAIRTGLSDFREEIGAVGDDAAEFGVDAEFGLGSAVSIPLVAQGKTLGALAVVYADSQRRYTREDLPMLEELGRRAGLAVQNASEFEREHRVAETFQNASLPLTLPRVPGIRFDAEYCPGSDEATIGGDWYDVFALDDGRIALTLGDVLGHGLHAAVTMTKLRQSMQSAAMLNPDPNVMLTVADKTLRLLDPDGYATAIAAIYDPQRDLLTIASAGHPGPMLRTATGDVHDVAIFGVMLGLRDGKESEVTVIAAPRGSTFVFYTDGLVEATRDIESGTARLREALLRHDIVSNRRPAQAIRARVLGATPASDDIAVLVVQIDDCEQANREGDGKS